MRVFQVCFVELQNTFDCVPLGVLWEVLQEDEDQGLLLQTNQSRYK